MKLKRCLCSFYFRITKRNWVNPKKHTVYFFFIVFVTDGQTDRRTDGQTSVVLLANTAKKSAMFFVVVCKTVPHLSSPRNVSYKIKYTYTYNSHDSLFWIFFFVPGSRTSMHTSTTTTLLLPKTATTSSNSSLDKNSCCRCSCQRPEKSCLGAQLG